MILGTCRRIQGWKMFLSLHLCIRNILLVDVLLVVVSSSSNSCVSDVSLSRKGPNWFCAGFAITEEKPTTAQTVNICFGSKPLISNT